MNKGSIDVFSTTQSMAKEEYNENSLLVDKNDPNKETLKLQEVNVIDIYPNPTTGEFTIRINHKEQIFANINVYIYGLSGKLIYSEEFNPINATHNKGNIYKNINIDHFANGIYIVSVIAGDISAQEKLVLKD